MSTDILAKLQSHKGYQGQRIRPHSSNPALWVAEIYTLIGRGDKKGWRSLRDEKERYRSFKTPEQAYAALVTQQAAWRAEERAAWQAAQQEEGKEARLGRIYPFSYRQFQEAEEALADLLRVYGSEIIWLLDIRFDPEGPPYGFRGSWLKSTRPTQYRHAKGLGIRNAQLYYPSSAIREILRLLRAGESFVLFSDSADHVRMVETLVRDEAQKQSIVLEDPYIMQAGDLCLWNEGDTGQSVEVILHHRTPDVYTFLAGFPDKSLRCEYVDIRDLKVVLAGQYRCDTCGKGEGTVTWREKPQQKLCKHCFWLWDLEHGEE